MTTQLLTLVGSGNEVAVLATGVLQKAGLQVVHSFDLNSARTAHVECCCPYHSTALCDCQMIVLLVYGNGGPPATLTIHGRDGRTQLAMVDDPAQRPLPEFEAAITHILLSAFLSHAQLEVLS